MNRPSNLMLLCPTHHELIDEQADVYTVERLIGIKEQHEHWVRDQLSPQEAGVHASPMRSDTVHSSLLAVDQVPLVVFSAASAFEDTEAKHHIRSPADPQIMLPYFVESGELFTFTPLNSPAHPFSDVVSDPSSVRQHRAADWWDDEDRYRWYVRLLNRSLNKLTGRRGLNLDKTHHRYYFDPEADAGGHAVPRKVSYTPLNRQSVERNVVWRPVRKKTGKPKSYWIHLAVALRFHRVAPLGWVLSVRPEVRLTRDGFEQLPPQAIGPRATRLKSHLYNYELLGELQFWKDYLTNGQPRAILDFGGQSLVIGGELMRATVEWPGVPDDERPYENVAPPDDLFTVAAYDRALDEARHIDAELEEWEVHDLGAMVEESEPGPSAEDEGPSE